MRLSLYPTKARNWTLASLHGVYRRLPREALRRLGDAALPLRETAYENVNSSLSLDRPRHWRDLMVCRVGRLLSDGSGMSAARTRSLLITLMWIAFAVIALTVVAHS